MNWDCVSCVRQVELDKHGRCPYCGSDAIAPATGTNWPWAARLAVSELERLYAMESAKP